MKKIFVLILIASMTFWVLPTFVVPVHASVFAGGSGIETDPYLISTPEQLSEVVNNLNKSFLQINDIDLSGNDWIPIGGTFIGTFGDTFSGTYDGDGYSIIGMTASVVGISNYYYGGLFAINDGIIKNIAMIDCEVSVYASVPNYVSANAGAYAGSIAGFNRSGTIENCYNTGNISAEALKGGGGTSGNASSYAGGITGNNNGNIYNCYNTGNVFSKATGGATPGKYVGGIAGYNVYGSINNCYWNTDNEQMLNESPVTVKKGTGVGSDPTESKTTIEFQDGSIVALLNKNDITGIWDYDILNINNGFPVLRGQNVYTAVIPSVLPDTYPAAFPLRLSSNFTDYEIYYTTDGSNPLISESKVKYTEPIQISERNTTVKAYVEIVAGNGIVTTFEYIVALYPVSPSPKPGVYAAPFQLQLNVDEPNSEIYYTTDGSDPKISGIRYISSINILKTITISAVAKVNGEFGDSLVFNYVVSPEINASQPSGDYSSPFKLELRQNLAPYKLYYTTNSDDPTKNGIEYTGSIDIYQTATIKVAATYDGAWGEISVFTYTFPEVSLTPSNPDGAYKDVFFLTLDCNLPFYDIYTDINGAYEKYTAPIAVYKTTDLSVQLRYGSNIAKTITYNYTFPAVSISNLYSSGIYNGVLNIPLSCSITGYRLYYTLDGSDPKAGGIFYTMPFELDKSATLRVAAKYGTYTAAEQTYNYTITLPYVTASRSSGDYTEAVNVTLTSSDLFYEVYYTLDGSDPKVNGIPYSAPIQVSRATVIRAVPKFGVSFGTAQTYTYKFSNQKIEVTELATWNENGYFITANVKNTFPDTETVDFYVAVYTDDKLLDIQILKESIGANTASDVQITYVPRITLQDNYDIKVMSWNSKTLEPYCDSFARKISAVTPTNKLDSLVASSSTVLVYMGDSPMNLTVTAMYNNNLPSKIVSTYSSESTNESVAKVENGRIVFGNAGSAIITVSYTENGITKSTLINVTVSIPMYSKFPDVPDYGKLYGYYPNAANDEGYSYPRPSSFDPITKYVRLLEQEGFSFSGGNMTLDDPVYYDKWVVFLGNVRVILAYDTSDFYVAIRIN